MGGPGLSSNVDLRYPRSLEEERRDMEWEWVTVTGTAWESKVLRTFAAY